MAGYSAGFGGNIGGMFSASDFFTITIQHLITTYVFSLGIPAGVILLRHRSGKTYAADLIEKEEDADTKVLMIARRRQVVRLMDWTLPAIGVVPLAMFACQVWTGAKLEYYLTLNLIVLALLPTWWRMANRFNFYGLQVEMVWCGVAFVVGVLGLGLNSGDADRRLPFALINAGRMQCGNQVVLSPIGDRFISATPDGRRHLIDDECKVQFNFAPVEPIPQKSLFDLVREKLSNPSAAQPKALPPKPTLSPVASAAAK